MRITHSDLKSLAHAVERWRIAQATADLIVAELKPTDTVPTMVDWHRRFEVARDQEIRAAFTVAIHASILCEDAGLVPKRKA